MSEIDDLEDQGFGTAARSDAFMRKGGRCRGVTRFGKSCRGEAKYLTEHGWYCPCHLPPGAEILSHK